MNIKCKDCQNLEVYKSIIDNTDLYKCILMKYQLLRYNVNIKCPKNCIIHQEDIDIIE